MQVVVVCYYVINCLCRSQKIMLWCFVWFQHYAGCTSCCLHKQGHRQCRLFPHREIVQAVSHPLRLLFRNCAGTGCVTNFSVTRIDILCRLHGRYYGWLTEWDIMQAVCYYGNYADRSKRATLYRLYIFVVSQQDHTAGYCLTEILCRPCLSHWDILLHRLCLQHYLAIV